MVVASIPQGRNGGRIRCLYSIWIGQFNMGWYDYIAWTALAAQLLFVYYAVRNFSYARSKLRKKPRAVPQPRVALIIPCKGLDARFHANIASFFRQDHGNHRLFFVVGETTDPAYAELCKVKEALGAESRASDIQILVAGSIAENGGQRTEDREQSTESGGIVGRPSSVSRSQKIHNLLYALDRAPGDTEIFAFADSDVCVHADWLARLVWPLRKPGYGVTTGYRWFIPTRNNLATLAMSAMNAGIAQLLGNSHFNRAWGGSMAIRADDFRRLNLPQVWKNTLSDDLSLSRAVTQAGMRVIYVPGCLVPSFEATTWPALYEFARRQFLITRVYAPGSWWVGFLSSLGSVLGLWGGAAVAVWMSGVLEYWNTGTVGGATGFLHHFTIPPFHDSIVPISEGRATIPLLYLAVPVVFFVGQILRAVLRQAVAAKTLSEYRDQLRPAAIADILGGWLWSPLLLFFILSSAFGRTIRWRGIRYKLHAPDRTEVL